MQWFDVVPILNAVMLAVVGVHLWRTSTGQITPGTLRCLVTGKTTCLVFNGDIDALPICADCRKRLRERLGLPGTAAP